MTRMIKLQALLALLFFLPLLWMASPAMASDAAVLKASMTTDDLTVDVAWDTFIPANWVEITLLDEWQAPVASQFVWPSPGARTPTAFLDFAHNLPALGFQFSVVVRDTTGKDLTQPHPFRVQFGCSGPEGPCELQVVDGIDSSVPSTHESLMEALDDAAATHSSDLLRDVLMTRPELGGPVISMAAQLERLDDQHSLGSECFCTWLHFRANDPDEEICYDMDPGRSSDGSGWAQFDRMGIGGGEVAAQISSMPGQLQPTVSAAGRHTMTLECWRVTQWETYDVAMGQELGSRTIRLPRLENCTGACLGEVELSAVVAHRLQVDVRDPHTGSQPMAIARGTAGGTLTVVDHTQQTTEEFPWQANAECLAGTCSSAADLTLLPAHGGVLTTNTRRVTGDFSGQATLTLQAEQVGQWSFARAYFRALEFKTVSTATCALEPTATVVTTREAALGFEHGGECGEIEINPWED